MLIAGVSTLLTIGLDLLLIPSLGLTGAGWGWLIGQMVGAAIALRLTLRRSAPS
jgi:Na+-driven multidrug efflux pump